MNYWWAEHDPLAPGSPNYCWRPTLQTHDSMCLSLEGVWFATEGDCLDFIKTHIIDATLDRTEPA